MNSFFLALQAKANNIDMAGKRHFHRHIETIIVPLIVAIVILVSYFADGGDATAENTIGRHETNRTEKPMLNLRRIATSARKVLLVEHKGYTLSYNTTHNTPDWVAWELTSSESQANSANRGSYGFIPDNDLPYEHQITTADYTNSGYDRGHMCPAGDMKWDADAMHDCFYMTNICPQVPVLNQRYWERLENACRRWAVSEGAIYIVCGLVYMSGTPRMIGREHMIAVPDGFYKIIVSLRTNNEKGIGFYYANTEERQTMESTARTIDQIEKITGYDFFAELSDDVEQRVESMNDLRSWN